MMKSEHRKTDIDLSEKIDAIENKADKKSKNNKKRVVARTVIRFILFAVISFVIGTSLYKINAKNLMHDQMPMIFGYSSAVVLSGSMEPTLSVDDLIIVKKFDDSEYKVDDVIVFQEGRSCTVHRIIAVNDDGTLTTQGDANNASDEPIEYEQIKGKVILSVPRAGKVIDIIKNPVVVIAFVVVIFLLIERSYKKDGANEKSEADLLKEEIELLKMQKEIEDLKKEKADRDNKYKEKKDSDVKTDLLKDKEDKTDKTEQTEE